MRVAHLTTIDLSLAVLLGTELRVDVDRGFDVYGISAPTPGPWRAQLAELGVTHVPVTALTRAWDPRKDLAAARELLAVLRGLRLDVLHTHTPKAAVLGRVLGRRAGIPVIVNTCHGLWVRPEDRWAKKALVYGVEALAAQCSDAELYQNDDDRRTLRWAVRARKAATVGNGVDLDRFAPDPAGAAKVRAELGVPAAALLVGGVGRRVAEKGIVEFAAAARALRDRATFVWVGPDDPDKPDHLRAAEEGVTFSGLRHDMPAVYSALDVFALPSHREGFSRSAMEAAACGAPMVLTDIRGCREIGRDGEHVLLVPPRDPAALTAAVGRLLDDAELRGRLAAAAQGRARAEFDQRQIAERSIATYRAVARRKELPWPGDLPEPARPHAASPSWRVRTAVKRLLAGGAPDRPAPGTTVLIYHRVGGGSPDERDMAVRSFRAQLEVLRGHRVVSLDTALDDLSAGDDSPKVVLTFDDGFADVAEHALPLLVEHGYPFTLYLATGFVGGQMHWDGSTAKAPGPALTWAQLDQLMATGLCTIGNHTHQHVRPESLTEDQIDACTRAIEERLGVTPRHFAYTWGIPVPAMEAALRARFRSAVTGALGRNHPRTDPLRLRRVPVRGSDPTAFFAAKLTGRLLPERAYTAFVAAAKRAGLPA